MEPARPRKITHRRSVEVEGGEKLCELLEIFESFLHMAASGRYGWPRGLAALVVVAANICYAAAAATAEAAQKPRIVLFFLGLPTTP